MQNSVLTGGPAGPVLPSLPRAPCRGEKRLHQIFSDAANSKTRNMREEHNHLPAFVLFFSSNYGSFNK